MAVVYNDEEQESFIVQKVKGGILIQVFIALVILCLVAVALAVGAFCFEKFLVRPYVGQRDVVRVNSLMFLNMGQSVASRLHNSQLFTDSYELYVTPESMRDVLMNIDGFRVGLYLNTPGDGTVQLENEPTLLAKQHWNLMSNTMEKVNSDSMTDTKKHIVREKRYFALNKGGSFLLNYGYEFGNVKYSSVNTTVSGVAGTFTPQCQFSSLNSANCTLQIRHVQSRKIGPVEPVDLPATRNFTISFTYEYEVNDGETHVDFQGDADLQIDNTVFVPPGSSTYFACDLKTFTCPVKLGGIQTMTFVATQESDPDAQAKEVSEQESTVQFSLKPKIRVWTYWTAVAAPAGIILLIFFCIESCMFCLVHCCCSSTRSTSGATKDTIDEDKVRLLSERRQSLYNRRP
jgi:hypothetical protein